MQSSFCLWCRPFLVAVLYLTGVSSNTFRIENEFYRVGVTVADTTLGDHTYVSELFINQNQFSRSSGFGWTANLLFNYSQHQGVSNRGRLSGTALVTVANNSTNEWHAPTGGSAAVRSSTSLVISNINLGTAAVETWTLSLNGPGITWDVKRTMGPHDVNATCDRMATFVFNAEYTTTGHVLYTSAQIPSFLDATLEWDPLSGVGFECDISGNPVNPSTPSTPASPGYWTEALSQRTNQSILLSPSSLQLTSSATRVGNKPLLFAVSYPTDPGTGGGDTTMALGFTTMRPPSHAQLSPPVTPSDWWGFYIIDPSGAQWYVPPANTTKYHFLPSDCGKVCYPGMAPACTNPVPVSSATAAAYTDGGNFSCSEVPVPPFPKNTTLIKSGEVIDFSWTMTVGEGHGVTPFILKTGTEDLDYNLEVFANVYNMWAGNIFGNSPASIVCLHEMSWFPMIQSVFYSPLGPDSVHSALAAELRMFAQYAIQPNGFVFARWNQYAYINMTIHDQMPHFVLAIYWQVLNTGDKEFLTDVWPALNKVMGYVLRAGQGMNMSADSLATTPTANGLPHEDHADNWLDIVNFGGKDAIINSYLTSALNAMAELATFLGGDHGAESQKWRDLHTRAVAAFNEQFWNETAGLYSDWIDTDGGRRNYFYVWQQFNAIDPTSGLTNSTRAARMLQSIDGYYDVMKTRYNKTEDDLWCTPTNLDATRGTDWSGLAPWDSYSNGSLQDQRWFGHYENGCCFMVMMGMEIAARGQAGDPDGAMKMVQRALTNFNTTRYWGQHYDWCAGDHCDQPAPGFNGADVIADSAMILFGAAHALFGFTSDLSGVHIYGSPAKALKEGATHTFIHLGNPVTLTIRNGSTIVS
eukprot:m.229955 g.229955  ORF g.229955 m.229955 type:complete len:865 (+) comp33566_c0_seq2:111-2705(+)